MDLAQLKWLCAKDCPEKVVVSSQLRLFELKFCVIGTADFVVEFGEQMHRNFKHRYRGITLVSRTDESLITSIEIKQENG